MAKSESTSSKPASKKKVATKKKTAKKKTAKKKVTATKKQSASGRTGSKKKKTESVTPEHRAHMISVAAYYHWEQSGHPSDMEVDHWLQAERDIDAKIG